MTIRRAVVYHAGLSTHLVQILNFGTLLFRNVCEHKREITMVFKDRDNMSRWRTFFTAAGLIREEKEDMISEPEVGFMYIHYQENYQVDTHTMEKM